MASNSSSEYKVVTDRIVSPDEDIIVTIAGGVYKGSIEEPNRYVTVSDLAEASGPTGPTGPAGQGVPAGGTEGQLLAKLTGTNYDTVWIDNFTSQIDQYVKNGTGTTLNKGQVVYINGADGNNPTITLASNVGEGTSSKTLGVLKQTLLTGEHGYVVTEGLLEGLNTNAATAGDPIWLGTNGQMIFGLSNKPSAPAHLVFVGYVLRKQQNNGKIYVKVQNGFELDELHNVKITDPQDGQVLKYNASLGLWVNAPA